MMARANPSFSLRPYLPDDAPVLADIFRASIEGLAAEDYSETQVDAWAAAADDEDAFEERLEQATTLVATMEGSPVGFTALVSPGHVDLLFVHPAVVGRGVGTMLLEALEKLANARGAKKLTAEVSDNASDFFRHRGFKAMQRNNVPLGGEWFANTTMEKPLGAAKAAQ